MTYQQKNLDKKQIQALQQVWALILPHIALPQIYHNQLQETPTKYFWQHKIKPIFTSAQHVYLFGPVGRGKTMICQLIYEAFDHNKQRFHFDDLCAQLHHELSNHSLKEYVTAQFKHTQLIWIDELQLYDIATAMLMKKFIPLLIDLKVAILMTGNVDPVDFYKNGLNRDQFQGFIPYFLKHFVCVSLNGDIDYRQQGDLQTTHARQRHWWPSHDGTNESSAHDAELKSAFQHISPSEIIIPFQLELEMRNWPLQHTLSQAALLDFKDLACTAHNSADYSKLIQKFPYIFLKDVPIFTQHNLDCCRRFMAFIDILYDHRAHLFMQSEALPQDLYQDPHLSLPFDRTASRLVELLGLHP